MLKEILEMVMIGVIGFSSVPSERVCCDDGTCASCVRDEVYCDIASDLDDVVVYPHNAWDIDKFEQLMTDGCEYEAYNTSLVFLEINEVDENNKNVVTKYTTYIFVIGKE